MSLPVIAICGRPNVGKSTLFNRIVGRQRSIVADEPGVTRDRIYAEAELRGIQDDRQVVVIDTGGFDPKSDDPMTHRVIDQTQLAMDEADVAVLVVDGRSGLLPEDETIAQMLRKSAKAVVVAVNKVDGSKQDPLVGEFYALGMGNVVATSAAHGRGLMDLEEEIVSLLPENETSDETAGEQEPDFFDDFLSVTPEAEVTENSEQAENEDVEQTGPIRIAVIGRPNVGKSSLVNRLLGEDRHLVSDMAGTTRDTIDSLVEHGGREYLFIDTAGIRRKRSIAHRVEKFSVFAALKGLERSDVAILLLDSSQTIAEQDAKVSAFAYEKGRAVILVISKWDTQKGDVKLKEHIEKVRQSLKHLNYAPIVFTSSKSGFGLERLFPTIRKVYEQYAQRIPTSELNRFVETVMEHHPPPTKGGKRGRIYYITQIGVKPPRFLVSVNDPKLIHFSYRRYLLNELRSKYGFSGVPLYVGYRARSVDPNRRKPKKR
ncbi:MAG: ribosome biogenesis GTPase Der [Myxococcota bacterium]|nr:ribosome biogenesis GTPase Der [Myxococcota bacterium]